MSYESYSTLFGTLGVSLNLDDSDVVADVVSASVSSITHSPIYIVQDKIPWDLTLETGDTVTFQPVGFRFRLPSAGENGKQELSVSIDNVDRVLSDFVDTIKDSNQPVAIRYRPYLSTDTTEPQTSAPLSLSLRDVVINPFEVSGRAVFAEIVNKKFPAETYTRANFPSLGD